MEGEPSRVADVTDRRMLRGSRSRQLVLSAAVDIASLESLEQLSFGRLATATGLSKAGVQGLFVSKESLQLAAIDHAHQQIIDFVVRPALTKPRGVARLRALIERWIDYAERPLFAGGCFQVANLAEYDSRPGPLRDALVRAQQDWIDLLAAELAEAVRQEQIAAIDPELTAFQIDALLRSANTSLRLGDHSIIDKVHRVIEAFLLRP
ncbi:TetR/AcrR family transcriptional regulator [Psychromicrobium lacuslunae]|uniref:Transcriptional regulator n=1 Tax=Psychromicrobium lacuslunae TaxID=1618207 RepID=A0A0D4C3P0_9MICC|nr:TetR/AcrR family transcriptional regulator [Psychromicrobium lacuslunae]AJT43169.1 transcriptional regulator [Psychromicrobium lacuslunae]